MARHALQPTQARNAPIEVRAPVIQSAPVIFSSPHSGRAYDANFVTASQLDPLTLRRSEDSFVDELFADAPDAGAPLIHALYPRAYLDPNREPWELDPGMFDGPLPGFVNTGSARARNGFGTIARAVAGGAEIYRHKLPFDLAEDRIRSLYVPYHDALRALIQATLSRFGVAVVIDCHSMPSGDEAHGRPSGPQGRPDIVLGDRYGTSCARGLTERVETTLRAMGYRVARNRPYAGAFITTNYGRPEMGVHALQIEINRALYMDERRMTRSPGLARLRTDLGRLIEALGAIESDELLD
jgi:N-formylglutamate amidohydrolase